MKEKKRRKMKTCQLSPIQKNELKKDKQKQK